MIGYCKTISGETIEIYDVHFCYPNDRFATYWVAVLIKHQPCDNVKGFLMERDCVLEILRTIFMTLIC